MKNIFILAIVFISFSTAIFFLIKIICRLNKEKKELTEDLETMSENLKYMYEHAEKISDIKKDRNRINGGINDAETDEEIIDVINSIVTVNNSRVRNDKS